MLYFISFYFYFFCILYISKNGKRAVCVCVCCESVCLCSHPFVYWSVSCLAESVLLHDHYEFSHLFDGKYFNGVCTVYAGARVCVCTAYLISFCCCDNILVVQHFTLAFVLSLDFNLVYRCFFTPFLSTLATSYSICTVF